MTALLGVAVLGLVPLPSMASSNRRSGQRDYWPTAGEGAEGMATHEQSGHLRHELGSTDASMAKNLGDAMKQSGMAYSR